MSEDAVFENTFRYIVRKIPIHPIDFRTDIDVHVENFEAFHAFFSRHPHDMFSGMEACKRILNERWPGQQFMCHKYHRDNDGAFQFEFCGISLFVYMRSRCFPPGSEGIQKRHVCVTLIRGADAQRCGCGVS